MVDIIRLKVFPEDYDITKENSQFPVILLNCNDEIEHLNEAAIEVCDSASPRK